VNPDGSYVFFIRLGSKPIEFEKGKNAIAVPSLDKIPLVIDILMTAVRNGERSTRAGEEAAAHCREVRPAGGIKASDKEPTSVAHLAAETHSGSLTSTAFTEVPRQ
jgi:hypothetical protein